jgi:hypothetical protein
MKKVEIWQIKKKIDKIELWDWISRTVSFCASCFKICQINHNTIKLDKNFKYAFVNCGAFNFKVLEISSTIMFILEIHQKNNSLFNNFYMYLKLKPNLVL